MVEASGNTLHGHGFHISRRGLGIAAGGAALLTALGIGWFNRNRSSSTTDTTEGSGGRVDGFPIKPAPIAEQVAKSPALQAAVATALGLEGTGLLDRITFSAENPKPGDGPLSASWGGTWDRMLYFDTKRTVEITVSNRFVSDGGNSFDLGEIQKKTFAGTPESSTKVGEESWYNSAFGSVTTIGADSILVVGIRDSLLNPQTNRFDFVGHTSEDEKLQTILFAEAVLGKSLDG